MIDKDESMFDVIGQHIADAVQLEISDKLFDDWCNSNLDEGIFYADWRMASESDDKYVKKYFNEYYEVQPDEEEYLEC